MLKLQELVDDLTNQVGEELTETYGSTVVAQETGRNKTAVDRRWGPATRAARAAKRGGQA
jgi:hypothetical protein